jgi:dienelactone hydrolase
MHPRSLPHDGRRIHSTPVAPSCLVILMLRTLFLASAVLTLSLAATAKDIPDKKSDTARTLKGTDPLTMEGDIASQLVDGVDKFLLREIDAAGKNRERFFRRDMATVRSYTEGLEPNRKRLAHILGMRDSRHNNTTPGYVATADQPALVGQGENYDVYAVRWPAFADVHGEGLLLVPTKGKTIADVVAIPDVDVTPEQLTGLMPGVPAGTQYARRLAESGCRVLVPVLIDRTYEARNPSRDPKKGGAKLTSREFLYRSAFELGRHLVGYEVQKVLAGVDWFVREAGKNPKIKEPKIGVWGHGDAGMLALYAGALDPRIKTVTVSGYFGNRNHIWEQPIDRNVFGLLEQFGDAELAAMVLPRTCIIEHTRGKELTLPSEGGAPARLTTLDSEEIRAEWERAGKLLEKFKGTWQFPIRTQRDTPDGPDSTETFKFFLDQLAGAKLAQSGKAPKHLRREFGPKLRQQQQFHEIDRHNQQVLAESPYVRRDFMPIADQFTEPGDKKKLDTSSLAAYEKSVERYREIFANEVVGRFDHKLLPANPRTRLFQESQKWTIYQVVLDVFPDVFAYGLLVIPKDLKEGDKRPVVVCQHGLEGRPEDVIGKPGYPYYKAFATQLAERGFVTFAPQNLYIFKDRFRTLQRKANPIKKTLFSIIVPQHQQITDWLKTLPFVDGSRIGFYGLSYGGKSAMRIPSLVKNYCLSICSADFNDWVWKNASSRARYSYVWTGEYEIFEFDLGSTFNYAEMAALIAPRPFMVERGHFDGVGPDERVSLEFAKVRHLYEAKLGIGDRTRIEWFVGPHTINGKGTFAFLQEHLKWPGVGEKK